MRLVIFSDLHYVPSSMLGEQSDDSGRKLTRFAEPMLNSLIKKVNEDIKPDLVLNLGDMIEDFKNHDIDVVNLKDIWNRLKAFNCPFYSIVGNHDLRTMNSRSELAEIMGYDDLTYSFDMGGYHFVMLGLNVKSRAISESDLEWLKDDLNKNKLPFLVFVHYGVAEDEMVGSFWFSENKAAALIENRDELKKILKSHEELVAVFSGHQHWTKTTVEDGVCYFVLGSLTENINGDGIPDGVYFEVELSGKTISVKQNHINIIDKVNL